MYPGALALDYPGLVGVRQEGVGGDVVVGGPLPLVEAPVGLGEERNLDPLVVNHRLQMGNLSKVQHAVAGNNGWPKCILHQDSMSI